MAFPFFNPRKVDLAYQNLGDVYTCEEPWSCLLGPCNLLKNETVAHVVIDVMLNKTEAVCGVYDGFFVRFWRVDNLVLLFAAILGSIALGIWLTASVLGYKHYKSGSVPIKYFILQLSAKGCIAVALILTLAQLHHSALLVEIFIPELIVKIILLLEMLAELVIVIHEYKNDHQQYLQVN